MDTVQEDIARRKNSAQRAFTRAELVASLAAIALLAMVVLPALAASAPRSQRLVCVSNLRGIGQSFASWSSEFGNRLPMQVDYREGGLLGYPSGLQNNAWFQFAWLSNHVQSPRIFVCPADTGKREASNFDLAPAGGFLHANYRNNALSYIVSHPLIEARPEILSGDRHLSGVGWTGGCAYWSVVQFIPRVPPDTRWTNALHAYTGNVVLTDGRVEQLSTQGLRQRLAEGASDDAGSFHYLPP